MALKTNENIRFLGWARIELIFEVPEAPLGLAGWSGLDGFGL